MGWHHMRINIVLQVIGMLLWFVNRICKFNGNGLSCIKPFFADKRQTTGSHAAVPSSKSGP